jgi:YVTN family beta-propeller protein
VIFLKKNPVMISLLMLLLILVGLETTPAWSFFNIFGGGKARRATIQGRVVFPTEAGTKNAPVKGAQVEFKSKKHTANVVTDEHGAFILEIPGGEYDVTCRKSGFSEFRVSFKVGDGEHKKLDTIILIPGSEAIEGTGISPDTVYVAFAKFEKPVPGDDMTTRWKRAAIMHGANPFEVSGVKPPDTFSNVDPYNPGAGPNISFEENSLMKIDSKNNDEVTHVKMQGRPTWLCFNTAGTKLFVATDQNHVLIYDVLKSSIPIGSVSLPAPATDMTVSRDGFWLFITYGGNGGVKVVDTRTNLPVNTIEVPAMSNGEPGLPMSVAVSRDNMRLFVAVASMTFGEVIAIDAHSKKPVARIPVGHQPTGIVVTPDGSKLFVANHNSGTVSVLSTAPLGFLGNIPVGVSPTRLCVSPDGRNVYVTCKGSNTVAVISALSNTKTAFVNVGKDPMGLAISGDGSRLYIANNEDATVSIMDTKTNYVIKTTPAAFMSRPYGVAVKP